MRRGYQSWATYDGGKGLSHKGRRARTRCIVVGLDGVDRELLQTMASRGHMPFLSQLMCKGTVEPVKSVLPTVSPVAWATYLAGANPGKHGIFGVVDRNPASFELFITNGSYLKHETVLEMLSRASLRVASVGVPMTYPPRPVNGVVVGCFLSPGLEKAAYPRSLLPLLKEDGFRIDLDPRKAREDLAMFLREAEDSLDARFRLCLKLLDREPWDFFQIHVMETDRVNHFLLSKWVGEEEPWKERFCLFYRRLDKWIGRLLEHPFVGVEEGEAAFVVLSDHGFCPTKAEIQVNYWLEMEGYLSFKGVKPLDFSSVDSNTRAYSLVPGRIYVNLKGREAMGVVRPGKEYEDLRDELIMAAKELSDPETGEPVIEGAYRKEELYSGPFLDQGPDIVLKPRRGYDLKAALGCSSLLTRSHVTGMHTLEGAFFLKVPRDKASVISGLEDVSLEIMRILGVSPEI